MGKIELSEPHQIAVLSYYYCAVFLPRRLTCRCGREGRIVRPQKKTCTWSSLFPPHGPGWTEAGGVQKHTDIISTIASKIKHGELAAGVDRLLSSACVRRRTVESCSLQALQDTSARRIKRVTALRVYERTSQAPGTIPTTKNIRPLCASAVSRVGQDISLRQTDTRREQQCPTSSAKRLAPLLSS